MAEFRTPYRLTWYSVRDLGPAGYQLRVADIEGRVDTTHFEASEYFAALDWLRARGLTSAAIVLEDAGKKQWAVRLDESYADPAGESCPLPEGLGAPEPVHPVLPGEKSVRMVPSRERPGSSHHRESGGPDGGSHPR